MPTNHSRKAQIRALMDADGLSYTTAMRVLDSRTAKPFGPIQLTTVSTSISVMAQMARTAPVSAEQNWPLIMVAEWRDGRVRIEEVADTLETSLFAPTSCTSTRTRWAQARLALPAEEDRALSRVAAMRTLLYEVTRLKVDRRLRRAVDKSAELLGTRYPEVGAGEFALTLPPDMVRELTSRGSLRDGDAMISFGMTSVRGSVRLVVRVTSGRSTKSVSFQVNRSAVALGYPKAVVGGSRDAKKLALTYARAYLNERLEVGEDGTEMDADSRLMLAALA